MAGQWEAGDRVRMVRQPDDPDPVPAGTCGTVVDCQVFETARLRKSYIVLIDWDNGRKLNAVIPPDTIVTIAKEGQNG